MSTYENAPATKLLATACACCGRALVDAVSVERGVGPDCAEKYFVAEAQGAADWTAAMALLDGIVAVAAVNPEMTARDAVNKLVFEVAKKRRELNIEVAAQVFRTIAALGFVSLAERIAARFRMSLAEAERVEETAGPSIEEMRAEYRAKLAVFTYDNASAFQVNDAVRAFLRGHGVENPAPADFCSAIEHVTCPCGRCRATGKYSRGGDCFRCSGRGFQYLADAYRNRAYDAHALNSAGRAA